MTNHYNGPRIDYLKFVVAMDYDLAQRALAKMKGAIIEQKLPLVEKQNFKISVLGPVAADPDKARYCVEAWGEYSVYLAQVTPMGWWDHLNRIDWRQPTIKTQPAAFEAFVQRRAMAKTGARNVTTFNTKNRQKTSSRDVGGRGITFGSRKSDSHTVAYARAGEVPVVEVRFQGRKAEEIGALMVLADANNDLTNPHDDLLKILKMPVSIELRRAIGVSGMGDLENIIDMDARHMAKVQAAMDFIAPEEADAYEDSTSTEEQEGDQMERWVPTSVFKGPRIK